MESYEINEDTLAVMPINCYETKIIEREGEYVISKKAYDIMDESCQYYGSTYNGRLKAAKKLLDCSYKIPILVEESENIIFFPTKSSLLDDCIWINMNSIKKSEKIGNKTKILFINGEEVIIDISKLSFDNQIYRSFKLESIVRNRMNKIKKEKSN